MMKNKMIITRVDVKFVVFFEDLIKYGSDFYKIHSWKKVVNTNNHKNLFYIPRVFPRHELRILHKNFEKLFLKVYKKIFSHSLLPYLKYANSKANWEIKPGVINITHSCSNCNNVTCLSSPSLKAPKLCNYFTKLSSSHQEVLIGAINHMVTRNK